MLDWYDIDFPVVAEMRREFLPRTSAHVIGTDLTAPAWLDEIPQTGRPCSWPTD